MSLLDTADVKETQSIWREVISIYLIMTLGTLLVDQVAQAWSPFASISVLLVALGFIFLPTEYLLSKGESPQAFGIGGKVPYRREELHNSEVGELSVHQETTVQRGWRCSRQALWISLLIFPFFIGGNHLWRTWQGQKAELSERAFLRWNEEYRGFSTKPLQSGEFHIGARSDRVKLQWKLKPGEKSFKAKISFSDLSDSKGVANTQVRVLGKSKTVKLIPPSVKKRFSTLQKSKHDWTLVSRGSGYVYFSTTGREIVVEGFSDQQPLTKDRYRLGEFRAQVENAPIIQRDLSWLWSVFLIQLFLVGLPEEIFYRGYIQTRLDGLIGKDRIVFGVSFNWSSTILCSALFAVAHLVTIPNPSRLAVFFPSLLFGWMRRAYQDTLSPAIFHALCNVLSQVLWGIYTLG